MASCQTIPGSTQLVTSFFTSVSTSVATFVGEAQTVTSSIPRQVVTCPTASQCAGNATSCDAPACSTSTTFDLVTSTIPGQTQLATSFVTNVGTDVSTSVGPAQTVCQSATSVSPSSSPSTSSSSTPSASPTTTTTPSSPSPSSSSSLVTTTRLTTTAAPTSSTTTPAAASSSRAQDNRPSSTTDVYSTITSYSTVFLTDSSGHVTGSSTSMVVVPTLLHTGGGSSASNKAAIGGGVAGGVVTLIAALALLWFLRKRGFFSRDGDEHFTDDMWKPPPHAPGVIVGPVDDDHHDGGGMRRSDSLDDAGQMMSEKDASSLGGRQSWYGGLESGLDRRRSAATFDGYGASTYRPHGRESIGSETMYTQEVGARRLSHRQSLQSHSSHSHDGYGPRTSPGSYPVPLPDPRLGHMQYYQSATGQKNSQSPASAGHEELIARSSSITSSQSESGRTVATTGSSVGHPSKFAFMPMSAPAPLPIRPTLETLRAGDSSLSGETGQSLSFDLTTSTSSTSVMAGSSGESYTDIATTKPPLHLWNRSTESLLLPSQFLGARVVNVTTPREEEKESLDFDTGSTTQAPSTTPAGFALTR